MIKFDGMLSPTHHRKQPKRAHRTEFSAATRKHIIERDLGQCVRCGRRAVHIHHILFRSSLAEGVNDASNGVCICRSCHDACHKYREIRVWFEKYRETYLLRGNEK